MASGYSRGIFGLNDSNSGSNACGDFRSESKSAAVSQKVEHVEDGEVQVNLGPSAKPSSSSSSSPRTISAESVSNGVSDENGLMEIFNALRDCLGLGKSIEDCRVLMEMMLELEQAKPKTQAATIKIVCDNLTQMCAENKIRQISPIEEVWRDDYRGVGRLVIAELVRNGQVDIIENYFTALEAASSAGERHCRWIVKNIRHPFADLNPFPITWLSTRKPPTSLSDSMRSTSSTSSTDYISSWATDGSNNRPNKFAFEFEVARRMRLILLFKRYGCDLREVVHVGYASFGILDYCNNRHFDRHSSIVKGLYEQLSLLIRPQLAETIFSDLRPLLPLLPSIPPPTQSLLQPL